MEGVQRFAPSRRTRENVEEPAGDRAVAAGVVRGGLLPGSYASGDVTSRSRSSLVCLRETVGRLPKG